MRGAFELWKALPRARPYLRPYRKLLWISMVAMLLAAVFALAEPWPIALVLNSVLGDHEPPGIITFLLGDNPGLATLLIFLMVARFGIVAIGHAFVALRNYLDARVDQYMVLDLRSDLFEHAEKLSLTFHDRRRTGQLMSQINNQAAAVGNIVMAFPPIIESILTLSGMLVIALFIDWQVTLASLSVVPLLYLSFGLYGTKIVPRLQRVQRLEWRSLSIVHEAMSMMRVIVSFGREDYEHRRFREQGREAVNERVKLTFSQSLYTLGVQSATALGISIVFGLGAWHVAQGKMPVGGLIVLMSYITSVYQPLEQISATVGSLHEQFVQFNASLQLLELEPEIKEAPNAVEIPRARGDVTVEDLSFSYSGRRDTLRDISFHARPGQSIAVVGETGAGKTTLMSLLTRFYDPRRGRILLDGIDIRDLKLHSLRGQISVVLQEPMLFSGTIAENIRYGRLEASKEEIEAAARAANAHDFISRLPDGYQTVLGERGAQLSGGERQRICVARAFLKDAPILVLDEPTSSIDSKTEGVILDSLDELMAGRTSFMVAHRLSTVRHADQILVMDRGRIVERGTHEELVEAGGVYRQLHEAQIRERRPSPAARRRALAALEAIEQANARTRTALETIGKAERQDGDAGAGVEAVEDPGSGFHRGNGELAEPIEGDSDVRWLMVSTAADPEPHRESPSRPPEAVDINRAGVDELMTLPGVGRGAARRIVAERERNGPFRSVADLNRVDGFDDQRVRRVWARARVS
jgi:competence ComEA-like helix-hairpin-helix protein